METTHAIKESDICRRGKFLLTYPVRIAQLLTCKTGATEVVGSNLGKGEDFSDPNFNCNLYN